MDSGIVTMKVDALANYLEVGITNAGEQLLARIPLDDVEAVWESGSHRWSIRVRGYLDGRAYYTNPTNAVIRR